MDEFFIMNGLKRKMQKYLKDFIFRNPVTFLSFFHLLGMITEKTSRLPEDVARMTILFRRSGKI